jgi:hypothetical protein
MFDCLNLAKNWNRVKTIHLKWMTLITLAIKLRNDRQISTASERDFRISRFRKPRSLPLAVLIRIAI